MDKSFGSGFFCSFLRNLRSRHARNAFLLVNSKNYKVKYDLAKKKFTSKLMNIFHHLHQENGLNLAIRLRKLQTVFVC